MMKKNIKTVFLASMIVFLAYVPTLQAVDIMKILEGYGRDSIATFSTRHAQSEAAGVFNLLLESNGEVTAEKAEDYLNNSSSPVMKSYLAVILADYAFVNYNFDSGLRYLKRAVDEHDAIRNDSYYRLVLARAQKAILESPGKLNTDKESVLDDYSPRAFTKEPKVKTVDLKAIKESKTNIPKPDEISMSEQVVDVKTAEAKHDVVSETKIEDKTEVAVIKVKAINYRMQIGAFGVQENALRKQAFFEEQGYPVHIEMRETSSKMLYIVQVGEFENYSEAKSSLAKFKSKFPAEDGIVVKVKK